MKARCKRYVPMTWRAISIRPYIEEDARPDRLLSKIGDLRAAWNDATAGRSLRTKTRPKVLLLNGIVMGSSLCSDSLTTSVCPYPQ